MPATLHVMGARFWQTLVISSCSQANFLARCGLQLNLGTAKVSCVLRNYGRDVLNNKLSLFGSLPRDKCR